MAYETKRQRNEALRAQLDFERSTFLSQWRDLGENFLPRRTRFTVSDVNRGDRRNLKIIDSTGTFAAGTLRSGMMSGITSPARPWFRLTTPDPDLAEFGQVKDWLHVVSRRMSTVFLKSNTYNTLPTLYGDLGVFGTAAMSMEEDFTGDVIRHQSFPIGSYMIAKDYRGVVNTFIRDFRMTARQLVDRFGRTDDGAKIKWENFSNAVKTEYENGRYETWFDICHVLKPNEEYDPRSPLSKYKKFSSCYYERGYMGGLQTNYMLDYDKDKVLSEMGYDFFPIMCPRWSVTGEDVYGTDCPGMVTLGDTKQLQLGERRIMQAIDILVRPPLIAPVALKNQKASMVPGDVTYLDERDGQRGMRPIYEINPRIAELEQKQQQVRQRIQRGFYEDLFLMLAQSDRREITAREIDERHEEKLLALGPVLEQLNQDVLDPLIDGTFEMMERQGLIPEPPDELKGVELKVEYISVMAQAQKLVGISGIERFAGFVGQVAQASPGVMDKVDSDQLIDEYADAVGISPRIVRSDEDVAAMRQEQQRAAKAQQTAELMAQGAGAARDLSQANLEGDNALTRMINSAGAGGLAPGA